MLLLAGDGVTGRLSGLLPGLPDFPVLLGLLEGLCPFPLAGVCPLPVLTACPFPVLLAVTTALPVDSAGARIVGER